jgi:uncharacterized MAPEG superfamily protein
MTPEITALSFAFFLQVIQYFLMAIPANRELGAKTTMSPRDEGGLEARLSPRTGRLKRAMDNHFEGLILFTIAVMVVELSGANTPFTAFCGYAYLGARILYVPAYAFGWSPWRSVFFSAGFCATLAMVGYALFLAMT